MGTIMVLLKCSKLLKSLSSFIYLFQRSIEIQTKQTCLFSLKLFQKRGLTVKKNELILKEITIINEVFFLGFISVMEKKEEKLLYIKEALTNSEYDYNAKLRAVCRLKEIFKPPDKIFSKMKLQSLLQSARIALENKAPEKDFLFNYGSSLVGFVGKDPSLDSEILYQLEYLLRELTKLDEKQADSISAILWSRLETESITHFSSTFNVSKQTVENLVLDWLETNGEPLLEFPARIAAGSPEIFQNFSAVLYQVLVKSKGHKKVLEVIKLFVDLVMSVCMKEGKDFLGLYPKDCCQLVTMLMVSPEIFCEKQRETFEQVNSLLLEMFLNDKNKAMILLCHYSSWVRSFTQFLNNSSALC